MILTADWHLRPETADTIWQLMDLLEDRAFLDGDRMVFHLGDLYHVRYQVPVALQNDLVDKLKSAGDRKGIEYHILPGNHDQVDVAGRNALEVLDHLPNVHVHSDPTVLGGREPIALFPFRRDLRAYEQTIQEAPDGCLAFCHHGIEGAMMNSHVVAGEGDGIKPAWFKKFGTVFLGHWHRHQQVANCVYVGSPWQTRADEAGQAKGYVQLDLETQAWKFHEVRVGPRHFKGDFDVGEVKEGDKVYTDDPEVAETLRKSGAIVTLDKPTESFAPRFALPAGATTRAYAEKYVAERGGDLDPAQLMAVFDEVAG